MGNVIATSASSKRKGIGNNFILLNGEQRTPDAAVNLVADKKTLLHQMLNAELKSREQFPSYSFLE